LTTQINVISRTQYIIVEPSSGSVSVINAGPVGPGGPIGQVSTAAMNQAISAGLDAQGVPPGGTTGQVLMKLSDNDYDVGWVTPS
jgi:hypothetical protein